MSREVISEGYPLQWPGGWPRVKWPQRARFQTRFSTAVRELLRELDLLGASNIVISSNLQLRRDGLPYASQRQPDDRGVAVYFHLNGEQQCIPCDKWNLVEDNLQAIRLTVAALRGLERWGAKEMVDAAFRGFKALPEAAGGEYSETDEQWFEILGVDSDADKETIKKAYREKAKLYHPDIGGDEAEFARIRKAFERGMSR